MAIIPGTAISTRTTRKRAASIIQKMHELLGMRRRLQVSRRVFLTRWSGLRKQLFLTRDYQELRSRLRERAKGICEMCKFKTGHHVCHVVGVSIDPSLALSEENCLWGCAECHDKLDGRA